MYLRLDIYMVIKLTNSKVVRSKTNLNRSSGLTTPGQLFDKARYAEDGTKTHKWIQLQTLQHID